MYVLEPAEQQRILADCEVVREDWRQGRKEYRERKTGRVWLEYYPPGVVPGAGPALLKTREETADVFALLARHLGSSREEDWRGVAADLFPTVKQAEAIVTYLEEHRGQFSREALRVFRQTLDYDRGPLEDKTIDEIYELGERIAKVQRRMERLYG